MANGSTRNAGNVNPINPTSSKETNMHPVFSYSENPDFETLHTEYEKQAACHALAALMPVPSEVVDFASEYADELAEARAFLCLENPYFGTQENEIGTEETGPAALVLAATAESESRAARLTRRHEEIDEAFKAVLHLYKHGRRELLNELDPSGTLATGEASPIYAALCLMRKQRANEYSYQGTERAGHEGRANTGDKLAEIVTAYISGDVTSLSVAAKQAGMHKNKFKAAVIAQHGYLPQYKGRPKNK